MVLVTAEDTPLDIVVTHTHAMSSYRNVGIVLWRGETTLLGVKQLRELMHRLTERHTVGIGLLQIVESSAPPPDAVARKAIADLLASQREYLRCSALVFEEGGFKMAAVRAIVSGISALARPGYPHIVFSGAADAASWIDGLLPKAAGRWANARGILEEVERLRSQLDEECGSLRPQWRALPAD